MRIAEFLTSGAAWSCPIVVAFTAHKSGPNESTGSPESWRPIAACGLRHDGAYERAPKQE